MPCAWSKMQDDLRKGECAGKCRLSHCRTGSSGTLMMKPPYIFILRPRSAQKHRLYYTVHSSQLAYSLHPEVVKTRRTGITLWIDHIYTLQRTRTQFLQLHKNRQHERWQITANLRWSDKIWQHFLVSFHLCKAEPDDQVKRQTMMMQVTLESSWLTMTSRHQTELWLRLFDTWYVFYVPMGTTSQLQTF